MNCFSVRATADNPRNLKVATFACLTNLTHDFHAFSSILQSHRVPHFDRKVFTAWRYAQLVFIRSKPDLRILIYAAEHRLYTTDERCITAMFDCD
jgi:hypothetical protein